jgi:hypothetical protein
VTEPAPARAGFSSRRKPSRAPTRLLLLLLIVAGILAAAYLVGRPRLALHNRLAAPIRITAGENSARTVGQNASASISVPWGKSMLVSWELVRPLSADGKPMGETVSGSFLVRQRWGVLARTIQARGDHGDYFAPLITNGSPDPLRVTVNAGLEGALDCGCAVRPDAHRVFIGYYRLYQNSTVQAAAPGRRTATFRDLGEQVAAANGSIGLRFDTKDFRVP